MNFTSRSKTRSAARRRHQVGSPAEIETFEARLLLTTPDILTPTGTITDATPEFTWQAVDNAESYDLWVTSLETYEPVLVQTGIVGTSFTPATELSLGRIRIWARANLVGGTMSAWSPSSEALIQSVPVVTGPAGQGPQHLTADSTPEITWTSGTAASRFQIWVTDLTAKANAEAAAAAAGLTTPVDSSTYAQQYTVENLTPVLDANGDPVLDAYGDPTYQEVRSFVLTQDPSDPTSAERELATGRYRVWIRSIDLSGRISAWSTAFSFDVGEMPQNLWPNAPAFEDSPTLSWDSVNGATHYEVYVSRPGVAGPFFRYTLPAVANAVTHSTQILQSQAGTPVVDNGDGVLTAGEIPRLDADGNPVPYLLANGDYNFWVRAVNKGEGLPNVYGVWSSTTSFSTLVGPTITAPVADQGYVTAVQPTVEWTPIHGAARYEILVHKFSSRPPYLDATSTTTTYTFAEALPQGQYTIWVRAVDTRGEFSPWSAPFTITATGGRPVVTSPTESQIVDFPVFTWVAVDGAASYEVWVAYLGVDFTFFNAEGITGTSYTPIDPTDPNSVPLNAGDYRVWVRAIYADDTRGLWSNPVTFVGGIVVDVDEDQNPVELLANVEIGLATADVQEGTRWVPEDLPSQQPTEAIDTGVRPDADPTFGWGDGPTAMMIENAAVNAIPSDALARIAQECIDTEWWDNAS
ncbi:MAG: hypothetical protein GY903_10845 [Fuerstiella sp.]|nr:hypothetical protein [Fuerstiella sp.]MCP4854977.1 hypothetical protein [Fuerstiella sp.]